MAGLAGIDLNLLAVFGALLEDRNLTRAGARIGMSQPAMSGALARLRRHFGDELLVRVGRGYVLTPLACSLLPQVQEALRQVEGTLEVSPRFDPHSSHRQFLVSVSDYALAVLIEPLLEVIGRWAPGVSIDFDPLPRDPADMESHLLRRDLLLAPLGFGIPGQHEVVFRDRFVCIADRGNPRLRDGRLSLADLAELPHAVASMGARTPADQQLAELGVQRHIEVTVQGLLPLPFVVSGTDLVAFVPERLARRCDEALNVTIADVPIEPAELVEAAHWHPTRSGDAALGWLRGVLHEVSDRVEAGITLEDTVVPGTTEGA